MEDLADILGDGAASGPVLVFAIAAGAWLQEDLALAGAGVLASRGTIPLAAAYAGAFLGVVSADFAVYLVGRVVGQRLLSWKPLRRSLGPRGREWFAQHGVGAVLLSRFLPGSRTAIHAAAGAFGLGWRPFLSATAAGGLVWTAAVVLLAYVLGARVVEWFEALGARPLEAVLAGLVALAVGMRGISMLARVRRRGAEGIHPSRLSARTEPARPPEQFRDS